MSYLSQMNNSTRANRTRRLPVSQRRGARVQTYGWESVSVSPNSLCPSDYVADTKYNRRIRIIGSVTSASPTNSITLGDLKTATGVSGFIGAFVRRIDVWGMGQPSAASNFLSVDLRVNQGGVAVVKARDFTSTGMSGVKPAHIAVRGAGSNEPFRTDTDTVCVVSLGEGSATVEFTADFEVSLVDSNVVTLLSTIRSIQASRSDDSIGAQPQLSRLRSVPESLLRSVFPCLLAGSAKDSTMPCGCRTACSCTGEDPAPTHLTVASNPSHVVMPN